MSDNDWNGRFFLYDNNNPQVYDLFKQFAWELKSTGHKRGSASMIFERMRWHTMLNTKSESGLPRLKLNNVYRAHYARKLMTEDPRFIGFFETRTSVSDNKVEGVGTI